MKDEIVEEVRAVRQQIFAEHDYDLRKLCDWLVRLQQQHPERLANDLPKHVSEYATHENS